MMRAAWGHNREECFFEREGESTMRVFLLYGAGGGGHKASADALQDELTVRGIGEACGQGGEGWKIGG